MKNKNIDLHCHTIFSDGALTPYELINRAAANGVDLLSITDHDTINAYEEASEAAKDLGIHLIPGCEISASWRHLPFVHILVYEFDLENSVLKDQIDNLQKNRYYFALETDKRLISIGLPSILDEVLDSVNHNYNMLFRTSFAKILVKKGICSDIKEAKEKYFISGKPGYVDAKFPTITEIIEWANKSNAKTVLAHPGQYEITSNTELLDYFRLVGGNALEVSSGSHTIEQNEYYQNYCKKYNFTASMGSDFHSEIYKGIDIGKCYSLKSDLKKLWETFNIL